LMMLLTKTTITHHHNIKKISQHPCFALHCSTSFFVLRVRIIINNATPSVVRYNM
jgi:hypothetical protein